MNINSIKRSPFGNQLVWAVTLLSSGLAACSIDKAIVIDPGEERGTIRVIDGSLTIMQKGSAASVRMIDGDVTLMDNSAVHGRLRITDGKLTAQPGSRIRDGLVAHHAEFSFDGSQVDGDVELFCSGGTVNRTQINGEIRVRKRALWHVSCDVDRLLIIGPESYVQRLVVEAEGVRIEISDKAVIDELVGIPRP